jgi:hypothetical protein
MWKEKPGENLPIQEYAEGLQSVPLRQILLRRMPCTRMAFSSEGLLQ